MNSERVEAFFGDKHQFPEIDKLRLIARVGVPVDIGPVGDFTQELAYGNHSNAQKFGDTEWEKEVADVVGGGAIVFKNNNKQRRFRDCGCPQLG